MITYSTWSPEMPARSSAAFIATPPRSAAEKSLSEPSSRPIGVRAPLTMTERDMCCLQGRVADAGDSRGRYRRDGDTALIPPRIGRPERHGHERDGGLKALDGARPGRGPWVTSPALRGRRCRTPGRAHPRVAAVRSLLGGA